MTSVDVVAAYFRELDHNNASYEPFRAFMSTLKKDRQIEIVKALTHYGLTTSAPSWLVFSFVVNAALDLHAAKEGLTKTIVQEDGKVAAAILREGTTIVAALSAYPAAAERLHNDATALLRAIDSAQTAYAGAATALDVAKARFEDHITTEANSVAKNQAEDELRRRRRIDLGLFAGALVVIVGILGFLSFTSYGLGDRNGEARGLLTGAVRARVSAHDAKQQVLREALGTAERKHNNSAARIIKNEIDRTR